MIRAALEIIADDIIDSHKSGIVEVQVVYGALLVFLRTQDESRE